MRSRAPDRTSPYMPDPQRTILRAPRLPRGVATAALLLVAAGAAFAATVGGVPGGLGGGALALLGLGAAAWRTSSDSRRFEGAVHGRVDGLIEELEEHRDDLHLWVHTWKNQGGKFSG